MSKSDPPSHPPPGRESDTAQLPLHSRNNVETIESTPISLSAAHFQMPQSLARNAPIKQSARRMAKQRNPPSSSLISQLGSIVKGSLTGTSSTWPQSPPFNAKSPESILCAKFVRIRFWDSQREQNVANFTDDGSGPSRRVWELNSLSLSLCELSAEWYYNNEETSVTQRSAREGESPVRPDVRSSMIRFQRVA
ncbi:hypothetical protein BJ741DRAFT_592577 [Chytriomyces cf. hyalinus JEL632]|nr:hypothetical protein BJ741DRAFT_592577 [Chytriomyces cf. hyalinus JEL632]